MGSKKKLNWLGLVVEVLKVVASFLIGTQVPLN